MKHIFGQFIKRRHGWVRTGNWAIVLYLLIAGVHAGRLQARDITHRVMVQPIVARDDNGLHPAKCHIDEKLIDQVYSGIGIDFYFLKTIYYDNNDVLKGKRM